MAEVVPRQGADRRKHCKLSSGRGADRRKHCKLSSGRGLIAGNCRKHYPVADADSATVPWPGARGPGVQRSRGPGAQGSRGPGPGVQGSRVQGRSRGPGVQGSRRPGHYMDNHGNSRTKLGGQGVRGITWITMVILELRLGG